MAGFFDAVRSAFGGEAKVEIPPGKGEVVIDVRSGLEFAMGHHPGAVHIPVQEIAGRIEALLPDKSRPIIVYCASGARAGAAAGVLKKLGYRRVENAGGLAEMARRK